MNLSKQLNSIHANLFGATGSNHLANPFKVAFYDGIQNNGRVDNTTNRDLYTKIVDQVLLSPTYTSRTLGTGQPFTGKVKDFTLDIASDTSGQWFTGLEQLAVTPTQTTVTTSYAHTAFTQDQVVIMLDSFANVGSLGIINIDEFKYKKAIAQVVQAMGSAIYGNGSGSQMLGLEAVVDDGTNNATIGGISRSTYPSLDAYKTAASSGKLTLALMAQVEDNVRAAGLSNERPNIGVTTKAVWSLYEQLLAPNIRTSYSEADYDRVLMKGKSGQRSTATIRNSAGFTALSYRNMYIIDDDFAPTGYMYFLNEDYLSWYGRSEVPDEYQGILEHVDFGSEDPYDGTGAMAVEEMPNPDHGFFYQKPMVLPTQAGKVGRFYVIGQYIGTSFRRQGKATGITGV